MTDVLFLAAEAGHVSPDHIAAKIAVPLGIVIFVGAVYLLLWSNYGAKKGALIYATAFFGFCTMLGVFWWFGAPGTPVATGLQNFPGQAPDTYLGKWFAFEPGSERAEFFDSTNDLDSFETVASYIGKPNASDEELEGDPKASFVRGDLEQALGKMVAQYLPVDEFGGVRLGAERRQAINERAGEPQGEEERADPFLTAEVIDTPLVTDDNGTRVAGARLQMFANYVGPDGARQVPVEEGVWFAFKDPGALWFPSAVWTGISLVLFLISIAALDRLEQREKQLVGEIQEAEDLAVPIKQ